MLPVSYDYPINGAYNETEATFADGRIVTINTQYSVIYAAHGEGCEKGHCSKSVSNICEENARRHNANCTCGALDGIDKDELIADARANGKFGYAPKPAKSGPEMIINPSYAHMSRDEIKAAEKRFDDINNEGGEGYNPYRDNLFVTKD
jgi:hypothetical protein